MPKPMCERPEYRKLNNEPSELHKKDLRNPKKNFFKKIAIRGFY